jgi:LysR family transcriptional regulator, transcription activator of glutamate synthase operon
MEQLKYVIEISKVGTISAASQNLHVSQSAISQSITTLESELGIKIFERSRLGALPTGRGKEFIVIANNLLQQFENLKTEFQTKNALPPLKIKISSPSTLLKTIILKSLPIIKNEYPQIDIEITEKNSFDIIEDVRQQKIDIGLVYLYKNRWNLDSEMIFEKLGESQLLIFVSKMNSLSSKKTVSSKHLLNQPIVLYSGDLMKKFVNDFTTKFDPLNILCTSNTVEMIKQIIVEESAATFFPDLFSDYDPDVLNGELVSLTLTKPTILPYGLVVSKKNDLFIHHKELLKKITQQFGLLANKI